MTRTACTVTTACSTGPTCSVFLHAQAIDLDCSRPVELTQWVGDVSGIGEDCTHEINLVIDEAYPHTTEDDDE